MWLCLRRRFPPLGLHKRILNSLCLLILLIHTKHKTIRWNLGLTPRLHSLEEELIHWIGMPKNLWLTVGQLFRYFSCKHNVANIGLDKRILNSPCLLIHFTQTKHKTIRYNLWMTPRLHFLEGKELTHWVDEAKNVWLIVALPIKAGWWGAPLALWDFCRSNKHNYIFF